MKSLKLRESDTIENSQFLTEVESDSMKFKYLIALVHELSSIKISLKKSLYFFFFFDIKYRFCQTQVKTKCCINQLLVGGLLFLAHSSLL